MRKGVLAILVVLAAVAALATAPAAAPAAPARPTIGIGDQKAEMFTDPRMRWLGIRKARLVVPWYVGSGVNADELAYVDQWLRAARRAGVEPLVGFGHGFVGFTRILLPSVRDYRRAFVAFRKRFPWVTRYIAWNEANHCSQPTCRKPERVAAYYDAMKDVCPACTVVGADVIDQPNMASWLRRFQRAARHTPTIYGLHNYLDVNRLRSTGTRRMLRVVPRRARVWITETGGVVRRKHYKRAATFPENAVHAGRVTTYLLKLARSLPRIDRVYVYHWNVDRPDATWDSGLIDPFGADRPGFDALARFRGRDPHRAPKPSAPPPPPPNQPIAQNPPPDEPPPSSPPPSDPPPSSPPPSDPPPPSCTLIVLCP